MNTSIWIKRSKPQPAFPESGSAKVDVAVIGGGIFGICSAYVFLKNGYQVALIEAKKIGERTSGNNTGKVSALQHLKYSEITEKHGKEMSAEYAKLNLSGIKLIEEMIEKLKLHCEYQKRPNYTYSLNNNDSIRDELKAALDAGLDVEYSDTSELPFNIKASVRHNNSASINPYAFCGQSAEAMQAMGLVVFENSRVSDIKRQDESYLITSERTAIIAGNVIMATHLPILNKSGHFAILKPGMSHCISAKLQDANALPAGMYISDSKPVRSINTINETLVIAGESSDLGSDSEKHYKTLEAFAHQHWPVKNISARWSTHDYMSPDSLPFIGRLYPGAKDIFTATGFSKWGLAAAAGASLIIRDELEGDEFSNPFDAARWKLDEFTELAKMGYATGKELIGNKFKNKGLQEASTLLPGDGGICQIEGKKVAAYRNSNNKLITLNPSCKHLGCEVKWNSADKTWDCPCHGSRHSADGSVLDGPTVSHLDRYEPDL